MALVEGGQLGVVRRILQTGIEPGGGITNIDLENISQVLPVVPEIVRRSAPIIGVDNWFVGVLENDHTGASDETSVISPYDVPVGLTFNDYPTPVPEGYDIWLMGASGQRRGVGTGAFVAAISMRAPGSVQGWGVDEAAAAITASAPRLFLGSSSAVEAGVAGLSNEPMIWDSPAAALFLPIRMRIPRGSSLQFDSTTAAAAVLLTMSLLMGLFPMAMGQDVLD